MGKHLNELKELDKIVNEYTRTNQKLLKIAQRKDEKGNPNIELGIFVYNFALLNYQFAMYLIGKFPDAVNKDKIDKGFDDIMKHFNNGKKK